MGNIGRFSDVENMLAVVADTGLVDFQLRVEQMIAAGGTIWEGGRQIVDERQLRVRHANDVARREGLIPTNWGIFHGGPVAGVEIANGPDALGQEDFGMIPAAAIILYHNLVGRRAADRNVLPLDQAENVRPFGPLANNQICDHPVFLLT